MKLLIFLPAFFLPLAGFTQLTGRVINDKNEGVPFATISIKNSTPVGVTDSSGRFSIETQQPFPFTLIFSSAGYESQARLVRSSNTNNLLIQLQTLYATDTIIITSRRRPITRAARSCRRPSGRSTASPTRRWT